MNVFGFSRYSPRAIQTILANAGIRSEVVRSVADANAFVTTTEPLVLLWERFYSFSHFEVLDNPNISYVFFADSRVLEAAQVTNLDTELDTHKEQYLQTLTQGSLPAAFIDYMKNLPHLPEVSFSREVKKTEAQKKKDTNPSFVAGAYLRQGIKDLLDMCGHHRESSTYFKILSYLLFLGTDESVELPSLDVSAVSGAFTSPQWSSACTVATASAIGSILKMTEGQSAPADGPSYEDRTVSAMHQLHHWLKTPFAPAVITGFLLTLNGMPETQAAYITECDTSSLNILCRNLTVLRPHILAQTPFYKVSP